MPKLARNMVKRGRMFYFRYQSGGCDRRVSLGRDYGEALVQLRSLKTHGVPLAGTVEEAAGGGFRLTFPSPRRQAHGLAQNALEGWLT